MDGATGAAVTVSVALLLVTLAEPLVSTTENWAPLSAEEAGGVV